jgi:hypothetical protein
MTVGSSHESLPEGYANYRRLSLLTKAYESMQGLQLVPFWLLMVLKPLIDLLPNKRPMFIHDNAMVGGLIFCVLWFWLSRKWYQKRYGVIEPSSMQPGCWGFAAIIPALAVYFLACRLDENNPPVSFCALLYFCSFMAITFALRNDRIRSTYNGVAAGCMLLVSLLPMTGWISARDLMIPPHAYGWGNFVFGVLMLIGGVLDHFLLVRRLSQARRSLHV